MLSQISVKDNKTELIEELKIIELNHFHEKKFLMVFVDTFYHKLKSVTNEIREKYLDMILNATKK